MKRTRNTSGQPRARSGFYLLSGLLATLLAGCGLQKDIDVELPAYPAQLVVEFYLTPGQVPQLTVTESTEYLASPTPAVPRDVRVVLSGPGGLTDTIPFAPAYDSLMQKAFTHRGTRPVQARPGDTFTLDVTDTKGRHVTGTATMPALVPIDTVEWKFNDKPDDQRRAYVLVRFHDPATPGDYYRFQVHRNRVSREPEVDYTPKTASTMARNSPWAPATISSRMIRWWSAFSTSTGLIISFSSRCRMRAVRTVIRLRSLRL
ncbi:hypothetical protein PK28_06615 [Hymenobacter sp. DG25B]|nr:DUF4249 family protein [Hymenobacter sp. DG25B]AIZ63442.1 hypothetical protein PK28_06615 [Hymenobacter sp. DG25B]